MNLVSKMLAAARGEELEENEHVDGREPNAPWGSYRYKPASPRVYRRRQLRNVISGDRKRQKQSRRRERAIHVIAEKEAVRRVREWEAKNGPALTHLLRNGDITDDDIREGAPMFFVADKLGLLTELEETA